MKTFFKKLEERIKAVDSLLCVGIDPHREGFEDYSWQSVRDACLSLIELTADFAAAYKPNAAFFEALGAEGTTLLIDLIRQIPDDIPVILDIKRGDISSTARAYANSAFEILNADAVTLNPYLGKDAIIPFLEDPARGAFILCKTSNPSAEEIQNLLVLEGSSLGVSTREESQLYEKVAELVREWNVAGNLGLVVGATQLESLVRVREIDPRIWILAPGIGAQGGDLEGALGAGLRNDGLGMLVPISRAISEAEDHRQEARRIRDEINHHRSSVIKPERKKKNHGLSQQQEAIAARLLEIGCIQFGEFTLKSGDLSPVYFDLRRLISHPEVLLEVAEAYKEMLDPLDFDHLAALPYAGLPIASAISLLGGWPLVYPRKEDKAYGTKAQVEGVFYENEVVVVIDDLITTGGSKLESIQKLEENGLVARDVAVLIDRSRDARVFLKNKGYRLHAFLSLTELLEFYGVSGMVSKKDIKQVKRFLKGDG